MKISATAPLISGCGSGLDFVHRQKKPNLLFVFPDQMRQAAMGFWNSPGFELATKSDPVVTPNIDKFARQSLVFTNAISNNPVCSPFRAMLMTGKYSRSNGVLANCKYGRIGNELSDKDYCFSDALKDGGYRCGYIGKWHLDCPTPPNSPEVESKWDQYTPPGKSRHGFDFWYSYGCANNHLSPHYWKNDDKNRLDVNKWSVEHETDVAIDFIRENREEPFALFLAYNPPHQPYNLVPEKFARIYDGLSEELLLNRKNVKTQNQGSRSIAKDKNGRTNVQNYFGAVSGIDYNFGRVLNLLEELGIEEDTIIVFASDHGEMMGSHDRMFKGVEFNESLKIPFIVRWKGKIEPQTTDLIISAPDIYPTITGLMGLSEYCPADLEGTDLTKHILGAGGEKPEAALWYRSYGDDGTFNPEPYWHYGWRGVWTTRYTYGVHRTKDTVERYLYDNLKDPYQLNKITPADGYQKQFKYLDRLLGVELKKAKDPFKKGMG